MIRKGWLAGTALALGAAGAAAAGVGLTLPGAQAQSAANGPQLVRASTAPIFAAPIGAPASFADIFERVSPAVVSIVVTTHIPQSELSGAEGIPFPFNQLPQFQNRGRGGGSPAIPRGGRGPADPDGDGNGDNSDQGPEAQAAGSGFFVSADGYIVTNNHVVENATKITVTLTDKRELPAKVIGRDEATDLAVIKVEGTGFAHVNFETQAKPRVGDWVLAIGNPLQLGGTATAGIISYVGRDLQDQSSTFVDYLQIDAPINRGNSGGPTFDTYGRVIGVNTAIYSQTGGSIGIGFAVPADTADSVVRQLMTGKTIQRGYLGATIQAVSPDSAEALGIPVNTGAVIANLVPGGPGEKAGLREGDLVLSINGNKVISSSALTRAVAQTHAGDIFRLGVRRNGRDQVVTVRAGTRPAESQLNAQLNGGPLGGDDDGADGSGRAGAVRSTVLGLGVSPLTEASRQANNIGATIHGVLIDSVRSGSDAARKGLRKGDVIVQANEQPVNTPADVVSASAAARKAGRPAVFLLLNRAGRNSGVAVKFDDRQ